MKDENNQLALSKEQLDFVIALYTNRQYQEAINQIESGFTPNYSDFNKIVDNYFFELKVTHLNDVRLLVDYLVCESSAPIKSNFSYDRRDV